MKKSWVLIIPIILLLISVCAWADEDYNRGTEAFKKGEYIQAISYFNKAVVSDPQSDYKFMMLGAAYQENKQYDEAITANKRAIELSPNYAFAYRNLGFEYGKTKRYDEAVKSLQKAIDLDPKMSSWAYGWMGYFLMDKNAYSEAAEAYKKAIEADPSKTNIYPLLAEAYYFTGRYDDAITAANKALEQQPTYGGVGIRFDIKDNFPIVATVTDKGPAKKADIQADDKILKINGESTEGWDREKVSQKIRGDAGSQVTLTIERQSIDKTFETTIIREIFKDPSVAVNLGERSLSNRHKGNLEEAVKDAEAAYSIDPANDWAQVSLGAAYLDQEKFDEAINLFSHVKNSPRARILEATAYAKLGKMKEAVNVYLSIPEEEISSNNMPLVNDRTAFLQTVKPYVKIHRDKALSYEVMGKYKAALSELTEALKTADETDAQAIQESTFSIVRKDPSLSEMPEDARKYALRGEMLVKDGEFEKAAAEFKKALLIAPYSAQLYFNYAYIYGELKKYPEAVRNMKIYLQAAPDAPDARAAKDEIIKWELMMEKE